MEHCIHNSFEKALVIAKLYSMMRYHLPLNALCINPTVTYKNYVLYVPKCACKAREGSYKNVYEGVCMRVCVCVLHALVCACT